MLGAGTSGPKNKGKIIIKMREMKNEDSLKIFRQAQRGDGEHACEATA